MEKLGALPLILKLDFTFKFINFFWTASSSWIIHLIKIEITLIWLVTHSVCQKLRVHSQAEKAEILRNLCNRFLDLPLSSSTQEKKVLRHWKSLN